MENNQAFVAYLENIQPIENADKIVQADVTLNGTKITQVVVGIDTQPHTKVVYFDSNMVLNLDFIQTIDKQAPDYGSDKFHSFDSYLSKGNRVKIVKLKNVISNGIAVNIEKFYPYFRNFQEMEKIKEGYSFTDLNGINICHKYLPPVKVVSVQGKKGRTIKVKSRIIPDQFHFHIDTSQLLRNVNVLSPEKIISISRKIHGTSAIVSNCKVHRDLNLIERMAKFLGANIDDTEYDYIYASRSVIKNSAKTQGFYKVDIWTQAGESNFKGKLHDGETVYYEIVGYLPLSSAMIQKGYRYGCTVGDYKIAVYRITSTGNDGTVYEYSWQAMKQRCVELSVPMVEEYYYGNLDDICEFDMIKDESVANWVNNVIIHLKKTYLEKKAQDCDNNPDEGIVIRIEGLNIEVYKLKSESFLLKESKSHEEEIPDIEEEA